MHSDREHAESMKRSQLFVGVACLAAGFSSVCFAQDHARSNKVTREEWQSRVNANREQLQQRWEELRFQREKQIGPRREELQLEREKRFGSKHEELRLDREKRIEPKRDDLRRERETQKDLRGAQLATHAAPALLSTSRRAGWWELRGLDRKDCRASHRTRRHWAVCGNHISGARTNGLHTSVDALANTF